MPLSAMRRRGRHLYQCLLAVIDYTDRAHIGIPAADGVIKIQVLQTFNGRDLTRFRSLPALAFLLMNAFWPHNLARLLALLCCVGASFTGFVREYLPDLVLGKDSGMALYTVFAGVAVLMALDPLFAHFGFGVIDVLNQFRFH